MRCEAGAYYRSGRIIYRCAAEATVELCDAELVYLLWCDAHAAELGPVMLAGREDWRVEPIETRPPHEVGTPPP